MKRKIFYVFLVILLEFLKPADAWATGTGEVVSQSSSEPIKYVSLSIADYQELLKYKFIFEYEKDHLSDKKNDEPAITLAEANNIVEEKERMLLEKERVIEDLTKRLNTISVEKDRLINKVDKKISWTVGASYLQSDKGGLGFALDCGIGYRGLGPSMGVSWQSEAGWGYKVGIRYIK